MQRERIQFYLCFALSATFLVASICILIDAITFKPSDRQCDERMSSWTPAQEVIKYEWTMFPAIGFLAHSEFFDSPLDEREGFWKELLPQSPIEISTSHLSRLNLSEEIEWIRSPESPDSVLALPEVFVQLECLNLLRRHAQSDEIDSSAFPSFQGSQEQVYQRLEQCFDRLRTTFRCWSDIVPVLMYIEDDRLHTNVKKYDFGTKHRCRDFGAIRDWTMENAVAGIEMDDGWWGGLRSSQ